LVIPVTKITGSESARLKMEDSIHERIIGQRHAVVSVSKAIRRARVGLRDRIDQLQVLYSLDQLVLENRINKKSERN
jgi:ATP-dependent Clp protease ATP-binding subunit ClpA